MLNASRSSLEPGRSTPPEIAPSGSIERAPRSIAPSASRNPRHSGAGLEQGPKDEAGLLELDTSDCQGRARSSLRYHRGL